MSDSSTSASEKQFFQTEIANLREEVKQLKIALQAAEDLVEVAPAFFGYLSREGRVIEVNELALRAMGCSREEVIGQFFWEVKWWTSLPNSVEQIQSAFASASEKSESVHLDLEYWALHAETGQAQVRWVDLRIAPQFNEDGSVKRFSAAGLDITEQVKVKQKYEDVQAKLIFERYQLETIFQQAPAAMALWTGPNFIFEKVNPEYQAIFPGRQLLGLPFLEALPEFTDQPFIELLKQVFETGVPYVGREILARHRSKPDGELENHYYDFTYMRVNDANGKPYGVYDHAIDVTDRVLARQALEESIKVRDDLLSICSHELRTPISSMKLSTQLFRRGLEKGDPKLTTLDRVKQMVELSDRQLDRLTRLIEEMLDFSRLQGGRLNITRDECDLNELVSQSLERIRPQFEQAAVKLTYHETDRVVGEWDYFRLEQVVTNLLSNALKYGAGKPIEVSLRQNEQEAEISIRDQGIGISPSDQSRIFNAYERAVSAANISGLGLGLYISHQIVLAHGGDIHVRSQPGAGSEFTVSLPKLA